jgi:hypothetical protein
MFAFIGKEITRTHLAVHRIDTGDSPLIFSRPYRVYPKERGIIEEKVKEQLETGIIRESDSPWASPVVLVPKKDGSWRFCIDYRKVNMCMRPNRWPMPNSDEILDTLRGARYFNPLDCKSGFHAIPLHEDDREKTVFICHMGLFEYNGLSFGLMNSVASYQTLMDKVLAGGFIVYALSMMH